MVKVITYGTFDFLHYGHIRLLERAKALGDYLIVGITADDFDKKRGKINVQQSLMERIEAVKSIGVADEIIIEEYEGQKIDDIKHYGVDIFTVGSDWVGQFDYLKEYCRVIYLERTEGVSSSGIRTQKQPISFGLVGDSIFLNKVEREAGYVNGLNVVGICTESIDIMSQDIKNLSLITNSYDELVDTVDAVYIKSQPEMHYIQIKKALENGKHVLCESPITLSQNECEELFELANKKNLILMEAIKTAYSTAYLRLLLLAKGGKIGKVVSVDAVCTSLQKIDVDDPLDVKRNWKSIFEWGPTALLPVFQLFGSEYKDRNIVVKYLDAEKTYDDFVKVDFVYNDSVASIKVGNGVKSEGELIISGTKGYIYVPSPWWKTDYFEIRYENPVSNKRYFYQLDGEGIRYELAAFSQAINRGWSNANIADDVSKGIAKIMEDVAKKNNIITLMF